MSEENNNGLIDLYKKRRRTGDYLDYSIEYYRQNLKAFTLLTLIFHVPFTFLMYFLIDYGNFSKNILEMSLDDEYEMYFMKLILIYLGLFLYSLYQMTVLHSITLGSIKHTYECIVNNNVMTVKQILIHGFKRVLWYILYLFILSCIAGFTYYLLYFVFLLNIVGLFFESMAILIVSVIITILICLAVVVVSVYFILRLYFVPHAISVEKIDCFKAIKLSMKLTKKKVRYVIWPIFFGLLFVGFIPSAIQSLVQFLPFNDPLVNRITAALVMAASGLIYPYIHIHTTQLYIFLKNEKGMIDFVNKLNKFVEHESDKITFGQYNEVVK